MKAIIFVRDILVQVFQSVLSILRIPVFARPWGTIREAKNRKDSLLILSNGPSLNSTIKNSIEYLYLYDCMCLNMFASSEYYEAIKPKYYVIVSPDMWLDEGDKRLSEKKNRLWEQINQKTDWPLEIFLPAEAKSNKVWRNIIVKNKSISIQFFNRTPIEGFNFFENLCFGLGLGMPRPHNVLIPSLMCGINLGYKSIYVAGADHSWLPEVTVNDHNEVLVNQKHFYDESISVPKQMTKEGGVRKLHEVLHKWHLSFKAYFSIDRYAKYKNVEIINVTPNSFIDAFKRGKLN